VLSPQSPGAARRFQKRAQILGQELHIVSGAILKEKVNPPECHSGIAGGEKLKAIARQPAQFPVSDAP